MKGWDEGALARVQELEELQRGKEVVLTVRKVVSGSPTLFSLSRK